MIIPGHTGRHNPLALGTLWRLYRRHRSGTPEQQSDAVGCNTPRPCSGHCRHQLDSSNLLAGDTITVNGNPHLHGVGHRRRRQPDQRHDETSEPCWARSTRSGTHSEHVDDLLGSITCIPASNYNLRSQLKITAWRPSASPAPRRERGGGGVGTGQVSGNDSTFLGESIAGGAVTTYDVSGAR